MGIETAGTGGEAAVVEGNYTIAAGCGSGGLGGGLRAVSAVCVVGPQPDVPAAALGPVCQV